MGPKKGKGAMASLPADGQREEDCGAALVGTRIGTFEALDKFQHLAAGKNNEHGASVLKVARLGRLAAGFYPIFLHCLYAGLVPPFSPFLEEVLVFYQIQLLHLHPNSILVLAIFAYLCEAYLGVKPSVALFRNFYALRSSAQLEKSGCVSFRISEGMGDIYIPMSWDGDKPVTRVTKKVDDFRQRWLIVDAKTENSFFDVPEAPPLKNSSWSKVSLQSPKVADLEARMKLLREAGLTGQMVVEDFVKRRIAPLQRHTKPMWMYSGPSDPMRLHCNDHRPAVVATIMGTLFINPDVPVPLNDNMRPLHQYSMGRRLEILELMPEFTPRGLAGEEKAEAAAPTVEEDAAAESSAASDAEPAAATGRTRASRRRASSSRAPPPEDDVLEISSDVDEDFVVAPSRPVAEESEDSEDGAGRREPRTKALHDRPAGGLEGTPLKRKAETSPEGPGADAAPTKPWRSGGTKWVDTRAKNSG